ncbi:MAG: BlaI/MecI/CopY family transcriptional regulator [Oscillospiraceae bacterium]|nr:BlaI/MecI/CopY family transcriptional regulator [Oscillospiraceae bacterium]
MEKYKLGEMEMAFAQIIWNNAPVSSGELVKICEKELNWKKSTTYTMLKRLCQREIFENDNGTVKVLITKDEFKAAQSEEFIEETFGGSLPMFLTAFTKRNKLSAKEIEEIKNLIDSYKEV